MKNIFKLFFSFFGVTILVFLAATVVSAQLKKDKPVSNDNLSKLYNNVKKIPATDSVILRYEVRQDTTRVRFIGYGEDQSLVWVNGYLVKKVAVFVNSSETKDISQVFLNSKFEFIKPEDIINAIPYNWK